MSESARKERFGLTLIVLGLVVVTTYLLAATGVIRNLNKLVLILVFAIGPVAMMGVLVIRARLALNLIAFPYIPAQSGLVDLGPVTGLWWLAVILQLLRLDRRDRAHSAAAAGRDPGSSA